MPGSLPRVVIDARPLTQSAGGFRSYVRALLVGLSRLPEKGDGIILYVDKPLPPDVAALIPPNAQVRVLHPSRLRADFVHFGQQVKQDAPDVIHGTANYLPFGLPLSARQTVTIHDAFGIKAYPWDEPLHKWTLRDRAMNRYWAYLTRASARRADRIITVSQDSKTELLSALPGLPRERITVIYNGLLLTPPAAPSPREGSRVLVMAAPDSRKNLSVVARAFGSEGEWKNAPVPCLDVVCGSDKTASRADTLLRAQGVENFRLLTGLDDAGLANAYARAGAFVWPSHGEGFGLPPLEALLCGCPVVSSSAPAMPEILGDAPLYFEPDDPKELIAQLSRLLNDLNDWQVRSERGKRHAAAFTPERMARAHRDVWQDVAEKGSAA